MSEGGSKQHEAWASGTAANAYFERNRAKLDGSKPPSISTRFLASHIAQGSRVLEVGTANGVVLEQLRQLTGCEGHGIDPSPDAVAHGRRQHPKLQLSVGTADRLDYAPNSFDVVLFGFCLYLVDRSLLMQVVAEVDRVLRPGGMLMITDFDPVGSYRREFAHQPGLWSYKMQYAELWRANPTYVLVGKMSFSHSGDHFVAEPDDRVASWVLTKQDSETAFPVRAR